MSQATRDREAADALRCPTCGELPVGGHRLVDGRDCPEQARPRTEKCVNCNAPASRSVTFLRGRYPHADRTDEWGYLCDACFPFHIEPDLHVTQRTYAQRGFEEWDTGGGCTAFRIDFTYGDASLYALVTEEDDAAVPDSLARSICLGIYDARDGDAFPSEDDHAMEIFDSSFELFAYLDGTSPTTTGMTKFLHDRKIFPPEYHVEEEELISTLRECVAALESADEDPQMAVERGRALLLRLAREGK